jgi:hypothetical protein
LHFKNSVAFEVFSRDFDAFCYLCLADWDNMIANGSAKCELAHTWPKKYEAFFTDLTYAGRKAMREVALRSSVVVRVLLLSAAAFFACGAARAQVNGYVVIDPIAVCNSTGTICPVFGVSCNNGVCTTANVPSTATSSTPIGFVDVEGTKKYNLAQAYLIKEFHLNLGYLPIKQWNSPVDNNPWPNVVQSDGTLYNYSQAPDYTVFHVGTFNCTVNGVTTAKPISAEIAAISQVQFCAGGTSNIPASQNPPPMPSGLASVMAAASANAAHLFIVNSYQPSSILGNSLINHPFGSVYQGIYKSLTLRPGADIHEFLHMQGLNHFDIYNAPQPDNGVGPLCSSPYLMKYCNVLDDGSTPSPGRFIASSTGCSTSGNGGFLYDLNNGVCAATPNNVELANAATQSSQDLPNANPPFFSQQTVVLTSGLINPTANVGATAGGATASANIAASVAGATVKNQSSSSSGGFLVTITDGGGGKDSQGEFIPNIIFAFPGQVEVPGSGAVTYVSGPPITAVTKVNGNNPENPNCSSAPSIHCIEVFYQPGTFVPGQSSIFRLNVSENGHPFTQPCPATGPTLAGTQLTTALEDDQDPAQVALTGNFACKNGVWEESTTNPDPATPLPILNPNTFVGDTTRYGQIVACTPSVDPYTGALVCPVSGESNPGID